MIFIELEYTGKISATPLTRFTAHFRLSCGILRLMKCASLAICVALMMLQSGCVTGRRELSLTVPSGTASAAASGRVFLAAVTDDRQFENKPDDPSTPSIDGDVSKLSAGEKDRMVGRQRNGFGHAMGDVSLAANDTVTKQIRSLIEQALQGRGFQVTSDPGAPNVMTVSVREFWSWMTPGFFALTFEAKIQCAITVKNATGSHTLTVKGYGLNHGQFAKDVNIVEAFDPAYADFLSNFADNVGTLGLSRDATGSAQVAGPGHGGG